MMQSGPGTLPTGPSRLPSSSIWMVAALVLSLASLRLVHLDADPPPYLDFSGGSFADEGPWLHNARNLLLYGTLRTDGWNPMLLSPLTHLFGLVSMSVLGVGLPQARVSAAAVFLLILTAIVLWPADRRKGAVAMALFGTSYMAGMFGRLVMVDNMVLLLSCATAACLCAGLRSERGWAWAAAAGILAAICLITKILVVFLVPAWYGALLAEGLTGRRDARRTAALAGLFSAGLALTFAAYVVFVRLPNAADFSVYLGFYQTQQSLSAASVVKNIITQPFFAYFSWAPVLLVLFLWSFYARICELVRGRRLPGPEETLIVLWLLGGAAFLSALGYRPLRYYLVLLPPMMLVVADRLVRMANGERLGVPAPLWPLRVLLLAPAATAALLLADGLLMDWRWSGLEGGMGVSLPHLGLLGALSLAAALAPGVFAQIRGRRGAALVMGAMLALELGGTMAWILRPERTIQEASEDLARRLPEDALVTGQFAIQLTFGTRLRAVPVWGGYYNADRPFERYPITHLLLWAYNRGKEIRNFEEHFPDVMARAREMHRYRLKRSDVLLYEIGR